MDEIMEKRAEKSELRELFSEILRQISLQTIFSTPVQRTIDHWLVSHENNKEFNEELESLFDYYVEKALSCQTAALV